MLGLSVVRAAPFMALATLLGLAGCSSMGSAQSLIGSYPVQGIDVSKYQGQINWTAAASNGVKFAYIKATEGGDRNDRMFSTNWSGARAAGIPTGAYHFYYFCRPVADQIQWFKAHVPPAADSLPPVLDMEWNPDSKTCKRRPPADRILTDMRTYLQAMQAFYGKRPIIYTTVDFHRDVLPGQLNEYGFWLRSVKGEPSTKYGDRAWTFWQYTEKGSVPGVPHPVDRNMFAGSEKDWQDFLAANNAAVPPATSMVEFAALNAPPAAEPALPQTGLALVTPDSAVPVIPSDTTGTLASAQ